jgi:hypothetical protein
MELMIRQDRQMNCSSEAAYAAAQVISNRVAGGKHWQEIW